MQQDADFITADFLYMFRASCAHHQECKILTRQPPVQAVMVAGGSSLPLEVLFNLIFLEVYVSMIWSSITVIKPYVSLQTPNKPCPYAIYCCSCSVFTVCATCNVISPLKYVLYLYISTSRSVCAVPNMAVVCSCLISCVPCMLLRYCLSDFEIVPVAPIITDITFAFTFHMRCISVVRSLFL